VLFGTTEGQTARIARAIGEALRTEDVYVDVVEAGPGAPAPVAYDAVIVAASVHAGGYQKPVRRWTTTHSAVLNGRPTAFVSVCLGVLQSDPKVQAEVAAIADRFCAACGWQPTTIATFAGALLYTRYNLLKRWMMKRIVRDAGGDTDTSRDYEYTDWNAVRAFAKAFGRRAVSERVAQGLGALTAS
jgi:menaquinone-dependent protoporphyrinogen oxidase